MNLARAVRTLHRQQWVPRPLEPVFDFFEHTETLTPITPPWRGGREPAMLACLRALPPVPGRLPRPRPPRVDDPVADTFGFGDRTIR